MQGYTLGQAAATGDSPSTTDSFASDCILKEGGCHLKSTGESMKSEMYCAPIPQMPCRFLYIFLGENARLKNDHGI